MSNILAEALREAEKDFKSDCPSNPDDIHTKLFDLFYCIIIHSNQISSYMQSEKEATRSDLQAAVHQLTDIVEVYSLPHPHGIITMLDAISNTIDQLFTTRSIGIKVDQDFIYIDYLRGLIKSCFRSLIQDGVIDSVIPHKLKPCEKYLLGSIIRTQYELDTELNR